MTTEALHPALSPEHLTDVLRRAGALTDGRVSRVVVESSRDKFLSQITRARLAYEGGAHGAPEGLHLLLEDLTDSHQVVADWPVPPTSEQCERIVETYARVHAFWWNDARLGRSIAVMPALLARYRTHRDLTLVNGDAHVWNLLYPRDAGSADVRFIDWSAWRIDTGTDDLAYMMAVHWYPERRRRLEQRLLDRYHAGLVAHGVTGYDRAALADDYRLSVLWQLTTPVWQAEHNLPPVIWWSHLERIVLAVDDLGCQDLLE